MNHQVLILFLLSVTSSATKLGEKNQGRELQNDNDEPPNPELFPGTGGFPTFGLEDKDGDGFPDLDFPDFGDGEGFPNIELPDFGFGDFPAWNGTLMDWEDMDWGNFDFTEFDWNNVSWGNGAWEGFLGQADGSMGMGTDIDFCPILESAIGVGQSFGIAGDCSCEGGLDEGLSISCDFKNECLLDSSVCGAVGMNWTIGDLDGGVSTETCVDFENDDYRRVCFSYEIDMTDNSAEQFCEASYGNDPCDCEIQDFCLKVDCSSYLPALVMDTCQLLETQEEKDSATFLPKFAVFDASFEGFNAEAIEWEKLDWQNVDWGNFDLTSINWNATDLLGTGWNDLFSADMNDLDICPVLKRFIDMSEEFGIAGDCSCEGGLEGGFSMSCSFEEDCTGNTDDSVCGSVDVHFGFDSVGAVEGNVCVDFDDEANHPKTCFSYKIPVGDRTALPECAASYGDEENECTCTIDENYCVKVDCSKFEPTAVTSTCQVISLEASDAETFIPQFAVSNAAAVPDPIPSKSNDGESGGQMPRLGLVVLALLSLPALLM